MSSFLSKLELDGENYTVLKCEYEFNKPIDSTTKPSGEVTGGKIKLSIESSGNVGLLEWIIAPDKEKDGSIIFYRRDAMSKLLEIQFKKAYCINFKEEFNSVDNEPMCITLTIVARSLKFNHLEYQNDWTM
ncbi:type VI secretion system tube protein TssD [Apibacter sp. HY039]|uniref:type VI secretion system tube protein TssD n=1 Tax=Apibacter sp. HY039 TaxID=2501476 RepID=UPI000FEB63DD|nr:type VI secretion system tube protein TssD [Apibacter sp. HY039]